MKSSIRTLALLTLFGVSLASFACSPGFDEEYETFRSIALGTSEADVIRRLGQPTRVYEASSAPQDYYIPGYSKEPRQISNKVLIYIGSEPIAYYYIDHKGVVEHVFVGGS